MLSLFGAVARRLNATTADTQQNNEADTFYLLTCGIFVFAMQAGFALLEAGTVRSKNVRNILLKNLTDACLAGVLFWLVGYGVAYGSEDDNGFGGDATSNGKYSFAFRVHRDGTETDHSSHGKTWIGFFFQYCFAAASTTIVSGAVAGRCNFFAYLIYATCILTFVYPIVVHWIWDSEGWLSAFNVNSFRGGMIDFAGSGVVHMTGGVIALIGAICIGPRKGRFDEDKAEEFSAHSAPLQFLGTMLLWVGWYGFNCGSTLAISGYARDAARVAVTTTLAACGGGLSALLLMRGITGKLDLGAMCNGVLGGLVGITAGCSVVDPWAALVIGLLSGPICMGTSMGLKMAGVDDPLDAFAVHGMCGFWGLVFVGFFCTDDYTYNQNNKYGMFWGEDNNNIMGVQLLGALCIIVWTSVCGGIIFGGMMAAGILRADPEHEETGLDVSEHEAPAYTIVCQGGPPAATTVSPVHIQKPGHSLDGPAPPTPVKKEKEENVHPL